MRDPVCAGTFYPRSRSDLSETVADMLDRAEGIPGIRGIKGAVAPHAGYIFSGNTAGYTFKAIMRDRRPDAYVIIGPDHHGIPFRAALCSDSYVTPMGECKVHKDIAERLSSKVPDVPEAHMLEHSVEVEIPFIQYIDPEARIVPIVMGDQSPEYARYLGESISEACQGFDVIVIASSDMSHYVPKGVSERMDASFMEYVCNLDVDGMYGYVESTGITVCGYGPIAAMIHATRPHKGYLLNHSDSSDANDDRDAVVGYSSAVLV